MIRRLLTLRRVWRYRGPVYYGFAVVGSPIEEAGTSWVTAFGYGWVRSRSGLTMRGWAQWSEPPSCN